MSSAAPKPLPPRPPRPITTHWLVDSAVSFLAMVVVALIFGVPLWVVAALALLVGALVAPLTRRAEERALAARGAASTPAEGDEG